MNEKHTRDLDLLDLLRAIELTDELHASFEEMHRWVAGSSTRALSDKQRKWAKDILEQHKPTYENLVSSGKVSSKCTVPTLEILKRANLPMRPPGMRRV